MQFYTPETYVPPRSLGYLLRRAERAVTERAESCFASRGLSFSQWIALSTIRHGIVDNAASLARALGHNSGATTRLIDQLEERGLVSRSRECADRRIVRLALTEAGLHAAEAEVPRLVGFWNGLLADFERDEVETLIALLGRLLSALGEDGKLAA